MAKKLYSVYHETFCTDHTERTSTVVSATSKKEALRLYLEKGWPADSIYYKWLSPPTIKDVHVLEVIS